MKIDLDREIQSVQKTLISVKNKLLLLFGLEVKINTFHKDNFPQRAVLQNDNSVLYLFKGNNLLSRGSTWHFNLRTSDVLTLA